MNTNINEQMYRTILDNATKQLCSMEVISELENYNDVLEFIERTYDSLKPWIDTDNRMVETHTVLASNLLVVLVEFTAYVPMQQAIRAGLSI